MRDKYHTKVTAKTYIYRTHIITNYYEGGVGGCKTIKTDQWWDQKNNQYHPDDNTTKISKNIKKNPRKILPKIELRFEELEIKERIDSIHTIVQFKSAMTLIRVLEPEETCCH